MLPEYTTKEFSILSYIDQNSDATQRELSEHVGVSLGTINIVLKKLIKKGFVKIEKLQPNSIRYFLTPNGIANKLERTHGYIVRTYREIEQLKLYIVFHTHQVAKKHGVDTVCFFGPDDDFAAMLSDLIRSESFSIKTLMIHDLEELKQQTLLKAPILVWNESIGSQLTLAGYTWVDIVSLLQL